MANAGTPVNPNWHLFGPSLEEAHLASIAAGGGPDTPFGSDTARNLLAIVHGQRLDDDARYADFLKGENEQRTQQADLGRQTELIKGLLPAIAKEGGEAGPVLRYLSGVGALPRTDTSEFNTGDRLASINQLAKAFQAIGGGVNTSREGGVATDASTVNGMLGGNVPGFSNVDPTRVQEAGVKAVGDLKPKLTVQSAGYGQGKEGASLTMAPDAVAPTVQQHPEMRAMFPDLFQQLQAISNGGTASATPSPSPSATQTMTAAPGPSGVTVPPQVGGTTIAPGSSNVGNVGADTNVTPEMYDPYNRIVSTAINNGIQLGPSQRQNDGSLLFPARLKDGTSAHVRLYRDMSSARKAGRASQASMEH